MVVHGARPEKGGGRECSRTAYRLDGLLGVGVILVGLLLLFQEAAAALIRPPSSLLGRRPS